jgi:hypothetical protein
MDSGSFFKWKFIFNHFNWLKCCPKQDYTNVSLAPSMMSIRRFLISWNFDVITCCGTSRFFDNQMAWIFGMT